MPHYPRHRAPRNGNGGGLWKDIRGLLEPETGRGTAGLVGASLVPGVGEAIDVADFAAGLQDRDPARMAWATGGLLLPFVAGSTLRKVGQRIGERVGRGADAADELPMDEASRVARREGWLDPSHVKERVLHGTTHEFDAFDATRGVPESHHGQSVYFTDQPSDVGRNYASEGGPDLTNRIEKEFENVLDEFDEDVNILTITNADRAATLEEQALRIARERVVGPSARTIPAHLRLTNPVDTRPGGTHFDWKAEYLEDVDDWTEPEGALNDIMEGMQEVGDNNGIDVDDMLAKVQEQALDYDGISAEDFEEIIRRDDYVHDGFDQLTGEPLGGAGEFLRRVYQRAGYDGTIVDAEATFGRRARGVGGMEGVEGATHYAVFDPKNIRSPWAAFDPAQAESANLIAGGAGLLGAGMARRQRERE